MPEKIEKLVETIHQIGYYSNHNHSDLSNLRLTDSSIKVDQLIDRAIELGYAGVNISDHESITGAVKMIHHYESLKKKEKEKGIKIIPDNFKISVGDEIYLVHDVENVKIKVEKRWHFLLTAKNLVGFEQLKKISSTAWEQMADEDGIGNPCITYEQLEEIVLENPGNLIATSACLGSQLNHYIFEYFQDGIQESKQKIENYICWGIDTFGEENFFLELQPSSLLDTTQSRRQEFANQKLAMLANVYDIGTVVATDSHYLKKEDKEIHASFLRGKDDEPGSGRETEDFYDSTYMMDIEEIIEGLSTHLSSEEIEKCFRGTMRIHDMVEIYSLDSPIVVPQDKHITKNFKIKHIFKDWYDQCPAIKQFSESEEINDRYFLYLAEQGFLRFNQPLDDIHIKRIDTEIHQLIAITAKLGQAMSKYYTLVRNLIHNVLWNLSIMFPGRGSVSGFYCAYLLEICQISAIDYNLPWWRHLHESKVSLADIDIDTEKACRSDIFKAMQEYYGYDNVLNCLTLQTIASKSAILISGRGLGYNKDEMQGIADLIPNDRGKTRSLKKCFDGDEENGWKPITQLINKINTYPKLKETAMLIEGLVCGRSIHASAVYIFENGYLKQNSLMIAKNKSRTTAFTMEDSDSLSALKMDILTVEAADKVHKCIDLLCADGYMEWQGSLKATYYKYLHPAVIKYSEPKMWEMLNKGLLHDAFQMDTIDGAKTIREIQPTSLRELIASNSLMRLQGETPPIEKYVIYKRDINKWYQDMSDYGLNKEEILVLDKILHESYGIACEQESVMLLVQCPQIANFEMKESDTLRKVIAKKKIKQIAEVKELYYKKGLEAGVRRVVLDYVWEYEISYSLGYSFSILHTTTYSIILVQEMNLAYYYPSIYWDTACLICNSSTDENSADDKIDYVKIFKTVSALGKDIIEPPDINEAGYGFLPDNVNNKIIYALKAIPRVSEIIANEIINNAPYVSFADFLDKMEKVKERYKNNIAEGNDCEDENEDNESKTFRLDASAIRNLIKAGSFDKIEPDRQKLLFEYCKSISKPLQKLTISQIEIINELNIMPDDQYYIDQYIFRKHLYSQYNRVATEEFWDNLIDDYCLNNLDDNQEQLNKKIKSIKSNDKNLWYTVPNEWREYFEKTFMLDLDNSQIKNDYYDNYRIIGQDYVVRRKPFEKILADNTRDFVQRLKNPEILEKVNDNRTNEIIEKYNCNKSLSNYEINTLGVYLHEHELANIDYNKYNLTPYNKIPEIPTVISSSEHRGRTFYNYQLYRICGVSLGIKKEKHVLFLLTPEGEVVTVKFYNGTFVYYNQRISKMIDGKNQTIETSWFTRGTLLMITGFCRDGMFFAKNDKKSIFRHSVMKVENVRGSDVDLLLEREGVEADE